MIQSKVILVTGASSGIGFDTCKLLADQGHRVYGAARRMEKMEPLRQFGVTPVRMDITDDNSVQSAVEEIFAGEGRIDVLVNNAGYGSYGAVEDVSIEEAKRQFDVNIFGLASLTKRVLPYMRAQHGGRIVNISSMAGRVPTYMGAWYHATKYALEGFSDALRMEVSDFGVKVVIIEPGGIKTSWGFIAADHLEQSAKGGAYERQAMETAANIRKMYSGMMMSDPSVVSRAISRAVNARRPRCRYLIGFMAKPSVFFHSILPARVFDSIIKRFI